VSGRRVVALGGGHGLAASLQTLHHVTDEITAVVTVADDGGSSGRLRRELGVLPPGDLRMALAALCGDDDWGRTWMQVVQHRFRSGGDLHDHSVGNLLMVALWEQLGEPVAGLDLLGRLLGVRGRVLPMSLVPLDIEALVHDRSAPEGLRTVRGQVSVATSAFPVAGVSLVPRDPPACPDAVQAVLDADWVVLGPGSWFTSVIPHLLVPELAKALNETAAKRVVTLNLAPQPGETAGFSPEAHLEVLAAHAPDLRLDVALVDPGAVEDRSALEHVAAGFGAEVVVAPVAVDGGRPAHDPGRLAVAYQELFSGGRI